MGSLQQKNIEGIYFSREIKRGSSLHYNNAENALQNKIKQFVLDYLVKSSYDIYYIFAWFFEVISAVHQLKNDLHYLRQPAGTIQIDYWRSTKINLKSVTSDCFAILNFEFTVLPDINSSVDSLLKFMICALHIVGWKMVLIL